jgi:hypothetical protein
MAQPLGPRPPAAVRLLVLDRPWPTAWEYQPSDLERTAADLDNLYAAAGRPSTSTTAPNAVTAALLDNLDVPRATAIARDSGGEAARLLLRVLSLT